MTRIIPFLIFLTSAVFAQSYQFDKEIGQFENASSFYINPVGYIFITDINTDEIYVLDSLGNFIHSIGGYGWENSAFDSPVDIFADALKIFVADKNNHRIQRFDKNLNFNFQIYTRENDNEQERFGYPLSAVASNLGDIFILDSENSRIIKFDLFGNFVQNFGGYDYGSYALQNPKQLAVSMRNNIYVIDDNEILIFDSYGNSIGRVEGVDNFTSIRIIFNWLTVTTEDKIFQANLNLNKIDLKEVLLTGADEEIEIVSSIIFNDVLYILTKKSILIFRKTL